MALIGKIQDKKGLLLIMIGIAMLAFIMGGWDSMFGSRGGYVGIGTVDGKEVDAQDFEFYANQMKQQDYQQAQSSGRQYTPQDEKNSIERAWALVTEKMVLTEEFDALGLEVTDQEFDAYLYGRDGFQVMPDLAQSFADSITGQFNPRLLEKAIERMEKSSNPEEVNSWKTNKQAMKDERKSQKYGQLLRQAVYVTNLEAAEEYRAQKEVKNISYAMYRYSEMPDEKIKVTDEEIQAFYNEHKKHKKYEVKAGRDLKFFDIIIQPSKKDSIEFKKTLTDLKNKFKTAKNDSLFILANSDNKQMYNRIAFPNRPDNDSEAKQGQTYPAFLDSVFKNANVGDVVGPYNADGKTILAKITKFNTQKLSARHILINANRADSAKVKTAKITADSIAKLVNKDNFVEFVVKHSEDTGSKNSGGEYKDFLPDEFVPEFSNFVINGKIGQIGVVQSDFGFHIIEILGKEAAKYPVLAKIEKTLVPSQDSEMALSDIAYNMISKFDAALSKIQNPIKKIEMFDSLVAQNGYYVRQPIKIENKSPNISILASQFAEDKLLKFTYDKNVKVGDISTAPIKDQDRYIIAIVTSIREKGVPNLEDVYEVMKAEVIKNKKAERFIAMMSKGSLEDIAKKTQTGRVISGELTFASSRLPEGPNDPLIVGAVFSGIKDGAKTIPIKGENGVYVVKIEKTIKAPATVNFDIEKTQLFAQEKGRAESLFKQALMEKSEIQDNRKFNQLGIRL